jgi:hypothetical protein
MNSGHFRNHFLSATGRTFAAAGSYSANPDNPASREDSCRITGKPEMTTVVKAMHQRNWRLPDSLRVTFMKQPLETEI